MFISESIEIKKPLPEVFNAFATIILWKKVLKDVKDITIIYDDGHHQEFLMTVERMSGSETVKAIRFCEPCFQIEMFQTTPPPGFKYMQGIWNFTERKEVVIVEANRYFDLEKHDNDYVTKLKGFLKTNLHSFKNYLESNA